MIMLEELAGHITMDDVEEINESMDDFMWHGDELCFAAYMQGFLDRLYKDEKRLPFNLYKKCSEEYGLHCKDFSVLFEIVYNNGFL